MTEPVAEEEISAVRLSPRRRNQLSAFFTTLEADVVSNVMDSAAWKDRAYRAGLTNVRLGDLLGMLRPAVSRLYSYESKRGLPSYIKALIVSWELLPEAGRRELLRQMIAELNNLDASENFPNTAASSFRHDAS